jgi:hypothetical protein
MKTGPTIALTPCVCMLLVAACQRNQTQPQNTSGRTLSMSATNLSTDDVVNPAFVVTADQLRKAYDEAELRGEKKQAISVGEVKSIGISVQNQLGKTETLKLSILFLKPLEQARVRGYLFGTHAQGKTESDRKASEDSDIAAIVSKSKGVAFRVSLQSPKDEDSAIPPIAFSLTDKNGARIEPVVRPGSLVAAGKDLLGIVELAEEGEQLSFPLFAGATPNLTATMQKVSLIVEINGKEQSLDYTLE